MWKKAVECIWRAKKEGHAKFSFENSKSFVSSCLVLWISEKTVCICIFHFHLTWFSNLSFLASTFWEHIVHMFWCCLKALWEARVDWKLSVLLKWVAQELELNSCHTPIELLSFINYFPCHLEQEWCHGLEKFFVGCIRIQCFCNLLITRVSWSFQIFICLEVLDVNKWVISLNVILKTLPPPLLAFSPPSFPFQWLHPACFQLQWKIH